VYNIFNERYFARVTSTGIDPAFPRNYFAGLKVLW
jgi:outer membrane receptor protein involved in Fe transport